MKALRRYNERWSLTSRPTGGRLFQKRGTALAMEPFPKFKDEVTEGRINVRAEEKRLSKVVGMEISGG